MKLLSGQSHLAGTRVTLRLLTEDDASEQYAAWLNDKDVNQYLETRLTTIDALKKYIEEKNESETSLFLGIFTKDTGEHIGNVKLEPIDREKKCATMGILIGEKRWWGKGIATEVTNLIVAYAFGSLGLTEVNLGVLADNAAGRRVYEKCGFETYRIDTSAIRHGETSHDQVWMRKRRA